MKVKYNFLRFPDGKTKALTLSYDDGSKDDSYEKLLDRAFTKEMYLLPIATDELRKNNGTLEQTWTWR